MDAYDADQMTTYLKTDEYLIEATHNPIMSAALTTPGWMEEHAALMRRSRHLAYAGAMVGTEATGRVVMSPWTGHEETRFQLTLRDMRHLRSGMKTIAHVFFAAGARRVRSEGPADSCRAAASCDLDGCLTTTVWMRSSPMIRR
ncbi:MAG: hypothetical protein ACRELY_30010 [Polyangiaceae bacterium]